MCNNVGGLIVLKCELRKFRVNSATETQRIIMRESRTKQ